MSCFGSIVKMSGLYDVKESSVIDEEMLEKAIEEQGPQEQAGLIAKEEGLKHDKVTQLRLDYRSKLLSYCQFCCMFYYMYHFWSV